MPIAVAVRAGHLGVDVPTVPESGSGDSGYTRTWFSYTSDPGDDIGRGLSETLHPRDSEISLAHDSQPGYVQGNVLALGATLYIIAPIGQELTIGTYLTTAPLADATRGGLQYSGNGLGCTTSTGSFTINELVVDGNNKIIRFSADFEQRCEGAVPALRGKIRINASAD